MDKAKANNNTSLTACTGSTNATILAWEDWENGIGGVWILENPSDAQWELYNKLPPTFDFNEHLQNLKNFPGAVHYANPRDHPSGARELDEWERQRANGAAPQ